MPIHTYGNFDSFVTEKMSAGGALVSAFDLKWAKILFILLIDFPLFNIITFVPASFYHGHSGFFYNIYSAENNF